MLVTITFLVCVAVLILAYVIGWYNENYWRKRGVRFYHKNNVGGPIWEYASGNRPLFQIFHDIYKAYPDEPAVGVGTFLSPSIYVKDTRNVQYVMKSANFADRAVDYSEDDQLADNMLFMSGVRWKLMRQELSPLFTSSKLKNLFHIMDKSSRDFIDHLKENPDRLKGQTFDTLTTLACAAMGSAVFGVGDQSAFNSPFLHTTRMAFEPNFMNNVKFCISTVSPFLFKVLNLKFFKEFEPFFIGAIKGVLTQRVKENASKNDFIAMCLKIQSKGAMSHTESGYRMQPTDELLAAQAFFFYIAGVEPIAAALFAAMIQLGKHPHFQKRAQEEVDAIFEKYNGTLTYEAVNEMEFLEKVLNESLRMFPPIAILTKRCLEDDVLPVGNIRIAKGTKVFTPVYEYHHDSQYFEEPELFDPERFSGTKHNYGVTYQPFGYGLRICIGMRYARLQVKSSLANILRHFDLKTVTGDGGIHFRKDPVQTRILNVDVEYLPRRTGSQENND